MEIGTQPWRRKFADNYLLDGETITEGVVTESYQSVVPFVSEKNWFFGICTKKLCDACLARPQE